MNLGAETLRVCIPAQPCRLPFRYLVKERIGISPSWCSEVPGVRGLLRPSFWIGAPDLGFGSEGGQFTVVSVQLSAIARSTREGEAPAEPELSCQFSVISFQQSQSAPSGGRGSCRAGFSGQWSVFSKTQRPLGRARLPPSRRSGRFASPSGCSEVPGATHGHSAIA